MTTKKIKMIPIVLVLVLVSCSGFIFEKQKHPVYYTIEYETERIIIPADCRIKEINLTIWDFDSSAPYNTGQMILLKKRHKIERSYKHQWIREPALLLRDRLAEDLEQDGFFTVLIPRAYTAPHQIDLMGKVEKWAWVESKERTYHAEISVLIQAWTKKDHKLIFKKTYFIKGTPTKINTSDAFAFQISQLVRELSRQFRKDLYKALCKGKQFTQHI